MDEHGPRAVVDTPTVLVESYVGWLNEVDDALGDVGVAGRRVRDGKEFLWESVEIVNRPRRAHGGDGRYVHEPMS